MWRCPNCHSTVDDSLEVCWSCGATPEGVEDGSFVTADLAGPIAIEKVPKGSAVDDPLADFAGTAMPDLVECYMASNTIEAKFVADQLMEQGIPAIADTGAFNVIGGYGAKVRVRQDDLLRALGWLKAYEHRCRSRRDDLD
jgi:hypothetical protein